MMMGTPERPGITITGPLSANAALVIAVKMASASPARMFRIPVGCYNNAMHRPKTLKRAANLPIRLMRNPLPSFDCRREQSGTVNSPGAHPAQANAQIGSGNGIWDHRAIKPLAELAVFQMV